MPKLVKFQNNNKNEAPGGTIFLFEILILVSPNSYLSVVKKAKWFFDGKKIIFQNKRAKNSKNM